jgi:hypothetical protein
MHHKSRWSTQSTHPPPSHATTVHGGGGPPWFIQNGGKLKSRTLMSVSLLYWRRRAKPRKDHMTIFTGSVSKNTRGLGCLQHACHSQLELLTQCHIIDNYPRSPSLFISLLDTTYFGFCSFHLVFSIATHSYTILIKQVNSYLTSSLYWLHFQRGHSVAARALARIPRGPETGR